MVKQVRRWLEELVYTDESTNALLFDADEVARQLCCTEQTFGDIQSLAHHNLRREKTIMDVTALRYPVADCLHFKVCVPLAPASNHDSYSPCTGLQHQTSRMVPLRA